MPAAKPVSQSFQHERSAEAGHVLTVLAQERPGSQATHARARCPRAFLPSPQAIVGRSGKKPPNPATSVTCSWTTPPLYESNTLAQEGSLRRACAALTQDLPGSITAEVLPELKRLHPVSVRSAMCTRELPPAASVHIVRKAFQSTALQSGVRHLKKASRCARSDPVLRLRRLHVAAHVQRLNGGAPGSNKSTSPTAVGRDAPPSHPKGGRGGHV